MSRLLQVHLSEKCNLKCKHCYQEGRDYSSYIDLQSFSILLDQFKEITVATGEKNMVLNLTGGEPLLFNNILNYIDLARSKGIIDIRLLTNGLLLTGELLEQFKRRDIKLQVSIEGDRECNDFIRGKGTYDKILEKITLAKSIGIKLLVSYTLNGLNCQYVSEVIDKVYKAGSRGIWFDRVIPFNDSLPVMTEEQFIFTMQAISIKQKEYQDTDFKVKLHRGLQFFFDNNYNSCYHCSGINKAFTVLSNGDVLPCRRMPITLGNFKQKTLLEIYKNSYCCKVQEAINSTPDECKQCEYEDFCKGGTKCLTYSLFGNLNKGDIHCPILVLNKLKTPYHNDRE